MLQQMDSPVDGLEIEEYGGGVDMSNQMIGHGRERVWEFTV